jgi:hypothetical protein
LTSTAANRHDRNGAVFTLGFPKSRVIIGQSE